MRPRGVGRFGGKIVAMRARFLVVHMTPVLPAVIKRRGMPRTRVGSCDATLRGSWVTHDRVVETAIVPTHDPINVESVIHALDAVRVFEAVTYQAGADNGMIHAIADADSGRILVRLVGRQANHDFPLPDVDRRAFRDCARL